MKRLLVAVFISLFAFQLCLLPAMAVCNGYVISYPSAVALPASDISVRTATLNGSVIIPSCTSRNSMRNGVLPASLQYAVNPDYAVFVSFQYGTSPGEYANETPAVEMTQSGNVQVPVNQLIPCINYYYRLKLHSLELLRFDQRTGSLQGVGVGLDYTRLQNLYGQALWSDTYSNEVSFRTECPSTGVGSGGNGSAGSTSSGPSNMSNITVVSATIATAKVSPGEKVDVAASVTNRGGSNGTSKVTLYINGQEAESKGISLASGESASVHFSVSRNDPGTYTVLVSGVPAGSFTVDLFTNNDALIYGIIALFTIGIIGVLYLVIKRRTA